ncbi:MAG: hypothetical protein QOJ98_1178, partial [Acidobacteriota bacterium]|nr:hypothetical protein [Acidobacteriota bacterium]
MLANGQAAVVKIALASLNDARLDRYAPPLLLGAMRVDVACIPFVNRVYEHMSLNHFYRRGLPGGFVPFLTRGTRASASAGSRRRWTNSAAGARPRPSCGSAASPISLPTCPARCTCNASFMKATRSSGTSRRITKSCAR